MSEAVLLAIDAGTTGLTAVLFDEELQPLARSAREFPQHYPQPGWVEHDAHEIFEALDSVLLELFEDPRAAAVRSIGITNQRETIFPLERATGRPLGRGIVWQDRRTSERCAQLRSQGYTELVRSKTGLLLDPYFSASKIEWMLRHDEGLARRAHNGDVLFATVDALVIAYLSGGRTCVTDPTNAARTMLFDINTRGYDAELCKLFGLQAEWLPEVIASTSEFAMTSAERTGGRALPIHGVAGDQQAALLGQGCTDSGSLKATLGTGAFLLLNTGSERVESKGGFVTTLALDAEGSPCYALEGSVFICGVAIQFLRDQLGIIAAASEVEQLANSTPDSGGVSFVPAFTGLGAPYWDADARGALLGLTRGTTPAHIARAALEAIAFQNTELIELFRAESGLPIDQLLVDGGAATNDLLLQIQADLAAVDVLRPANVEATARGAALLAGLGSGLWKNRAVPRVEARAPESFKPTLGSAERRARLASWRGAVARVRS